MYSLPLPVLFDLQRLLKWFARAGIHRAVLGLRFEEDPHATQRANMRLPDAQFPEVPHNELAMMELARRAGIDVPEMRLVHRDQIEAVSRQDRL